MDCEVGPLKVSKIEAFPRLTCQKPISDEAGGVVCRISPSVPHYTFSGFQVSQPNHIIDLPHTLSYSLESLVNHQQPHHSSRLGRPCIWRTIITQAYASYFAAFFC